MLRNFLGVNVQTSGTFRQERHAGASYVVVPVVALVEGVIQGITAETPELALASEFGRFPASWNGRPITIDHPFVTTEEGGIIRVSASTSPDILDDFQVGFIFNAQMKGDKLVMEAWIDPIKLSNHSSEGRALLQKIKRGEPIEVSTGLFTNVEHSSGEHDGERYFSVWRGVVPDHLAFLLEGTVGACSLEDGCGANVTTLSKRAGEGVGETNHSGVLRVHHLLAGGCSCGGTCDVCGGQQNEESEANNSTSTDLNGSVGSVDTKSQTAKKPKSKRPLQSKRSNASNQMQQFFVGVLANAMPGGMMDSDVRQMLQSALDEQHNTDAGDSSGDMASAPYLMGFTRDHAVYSKYSGKTGSRTTHRRSYKISPTQKVSLGDDEEQVNLTTAVTPKSNQAPVTSDPATSTPGNSSKESEMTTPTQQGNPATEGAVTTPGNVTANTTPTTPVATTPVVTPVVATPSPVGTVTTNVSTPAGERREEKQMTLAEFLTAAPKEIRESLQAGMKMHEDRKQGIIRDLTACGRCKFSPDQLNSFDLTMLENLAELSRVPSFEGVAPAGSFAANTTPQIQEGDSAWAPAPPRLGIVANRGVQKADPNTNTQAA